jgi:quercetin dioxygenase-like cupin family protein
MFIEVKDMKPELRENMRGGDGTVVITNILPKECLPPKARLSAVITLNKGCGIGEHKHEGEEEIFYCISGEGVLNDNGVSKTIRKGDSHICKDGETHSIRNDKDEQLIFFAVIVLNH